MSPATSIYLWVRINLGTESCKAVSTRWPTDRESGDAYAGHQLEHLLLSAIKQGGNFFE